MTSQIKRKKPDFIKQESHKKKRLSKNWRKPKGLHSKLRLGHRGHRKSISQGYRSALNSRGLHKSGLKAIVVCSEKDLNSINKESEGIITSKTIGLKKKIVLLKSAKEKGLTVLNINVDKFLKESEERMKKKKESKKKKTEEKEKKIKEAEKKAEEKKEELAEKVSEEEEKEKEKKDKDKLLTKKEV